MQLEDVMSRVTPASVADLYLQSRSSESKEHTETSALSVVGGEDCVKRFESVQERHDALAESAAGKARSVMRKAMTRVLDEELQHRHDVGGVFLEMTVLKFLLFLLSQWLTCDLWFGTANARTL